MRNSRGCARSWRRTSARPSRKASWGDEAVLLADGGGVGRVLLGRAAQDREVGVAQHLAVAVAGGGLVGDGEADEAGGLGGAGGVDAQLGQGALGEMGGALLVLGAVGAVDGVVEPGGEADGVDVVGVRRQLVEVPEDGGEVIDRVVPALWLRPAGEQVVGVRTGIGLPDRAHPLDGLPPGGAQCRSGRVLGRGCHGSIVGYGFLSGFLPRRRDSGAGCQGADEERAGLPDLGRGDLVRQGVAEAVLLQSVGPHLGGVVPALDDEGVGVVGLVDVGRLAAVAAFDRGAAGRRRARRRA
ncbi:hypothetical protein GCM10020000_33760 [Streptomyces olivoverticillatus]